MRRRLALTAALLLGASTEPALAQSTTRSLDLAAACRMTGGAGARLVLRRNDAYGWACGRPGSEVGLNLTAACRSQYNDVRLEAAYGNFANPNSWYCRTSAPTQPPPPQVVATATANRAPWKAVLLLFRNIDVTYIASDGRPRRWLSALSDAEIAQNRAAFANLPGLVRDGSNGEATMTTRVLVIDAPIRRVNQSGAGADLSLHPSDVRERLAADAPAERFDSVFVVWPRYDRSGRDRELPHGIWGVGSYWEGFATYAAIANLDNGGGPYPGEVFLHEWLHGAAGFYRRKGYKMPAGDADGGGGHGYTPGSEGWMPYYRDLMRANVLENGQRLGIPAAAWRSGPPWPPVARTP